MSSSWAVSSRGSSKFLGFAGEAPSLVVVVASDDDDTALLLVCVDTLLVDLPADIDEEVDACFLDCDFTLGVNCVDEFLFGAAGPTATMTTFDNNF